MENGQPTKTDGELENPEDISEGSAASLHSENTEGAGSKSSSKTMTATTLKGSRKTLTSAALEALQSKAGLVAGALADFQAAGGIVGTEQKEYEFGGKKFTAIRVFLIVNGANVVAVKTPDGLDFNVVAAES